MSQPIESRKRLSSTEGDGEAFDVQSLSIQASGHEDTLFECKCQVGESATGRSKTLYKKIDAKEHENYVEIFAKDDPLQRALPRFWGVVESDIENGQSNDEAGVQRYLILEHLLAEFMFPFVMDCKLGIRSYEESECKSKKARPDLYQRLLKIGPEYLSEEDHINGSITKHFWMSTRDSMSSLKRLGFRVDGVVGPGNLKIHADYFANIVEKEKVLVELKRFLDNLPCMGDSEASTRDHQREAVLVRRELAALIAEKVQEVRDSCVASEFFARHEFIGASLLIIVEASPPRMKPRVRVAVIDLAKTSLLPDDCKVDHRKSWAPGNHEDGVLLGLENFFACWGQVQAQYCEEFHEFGALPSRAEAMAQIFGQSGDSPRDEPFHLPNGIKSIPAANSDTRLCTDIITRVSCGLCG